MGRRLSAFLGRAVPLAMLYLSLVLSYLPSYPIPSLSLPSAAAFFPSLMSIPSLYLSSLLLLLDFFLHPITRGSLSSSHLSSVHAATIQHSPSPSSSLRSLPLLVTVRTALVLLPLLLSALWLAVGAATVFIRVKRFRTVGEAGEQMRRDVDKGREESKRRGIKCE